MDLTVERSALRAELARLRRVLQARPARPILSAVLLEVAVGSDRLQMRASSGDLSLHTTCPVTTRRGGQVAVDARILQSLVEQLPSEPITMRALARWAEVESAGVSARLPAWPAEDYPASPSVTGGTVDLPARTLRSGLRRTGFVVRGDTPVHQQAVQLTVGGGRLALIATDGRRIARVVAPLGDAASPLVELLPSRLVVELDRFLDAAGDASVSCTVGDRHLSFRLGARVLVSGRLETRFPACDGLLNAERPYRVRCERRSLREAVERAAVVFDDDHRRLDLSIGPDSLRVSAGSPARGQVSEDVPATYQGPSLDLGVDIRYLLDYLAVETAERVTMAFSDEARLVCWSGEGEDIDEYRYVVASMCHV